ncbi:MAG: hypothetical protein R6T83_04665 [Salinibacter sp.]
MAQASLTSFLDVSPNSSFPIQNLPYGVFVPPKASTPRVGVAIGEQERPRSSSEVVATLWEVLLIGEHRFP